MAGIWILVADRVRARLFEAENTRAGAREIDSWVHPQGHVPAGSRGPRRPPRNQESVGSARHAIEPRTPPAQVESERFARELCTHLEAGRVAHRFEALVVAAQPRFLGELRAAMGSDLRGQVRAEIAKDLTRSRLPRIDSEVQAALAPQ